MRILLIEDDEQLARNITIFLEDAGYIVDAVTEGRKGAVKAELYPYAAIILDWMLPDGNGPEIAKVLRDKGVHTPIIMTTAKGQINDRLTGFTVGVDDYLVKPYDLNELVARISAIIRRSVAGTTSQKVACGDLELDLSACSLSHKGESIALTPKEYGIIELLFLHMGKVVEKDELMHNVWHDDVDLFTNNLEVHIKNLRQKIDKPFGTEHLKTVKGKGYMIVA